MVTIRQARATDIPWLLTQCKLFAEFFGSTHSLFPDELVAVEKLTALMNPDVGCFLIAEGNAGALGFIAGLLGPQFFNPALTQLTELLWWVAPEHRGTSAGARLLNAFTQYGKDHAAWIVFTLEENSPVNPASLERRGYRLHERSYLLEVEDVCSSITDAQPGCSAATAEPEWPALDAQLAALAPVED